MKTSIFILSLLFSFPIFSQDKHAEDVSSLDNVMTTLYSVISGDKGVERDWPRFKNLFIEEARLMPSGKGDDGNIKYRIMSPDEYIETSGKWLIENGK